MDRRNFISAFVRGGVLVGLVATSGYLLLRKGGNSSGCDAICRSCRDLPGCPKPEAIQAKEEITKKTK